jgi:hypothetical protein
MEPIRERLLGQAKRRKIAVEELTDEEITLVRTTLANQFTDGDQNVQLKYYPFDFHILEPDCWAWVIDFVQDLSDIVLIFLGSDRLNVKISNGSDLWQILFASGFCGYPQGEFAITDLSGSFLIVYDHENALYTLGSATDWLVSIREIKLDLKKVV